MTLQTATVCLSVPDEAEIRDIIYLQDYITPWQERGMPTSAATIWDHQFKPDPIRPGHRRIQLHSHTEGVARRNQS